MTETVPGTFFCLSLGCFKNRVDSERIAGLLRRAGYRLVPEAEGADLCIVNTCGFLRSAVEENIEAILDLAALRKEGRVGRVGVVGCLVNRYAGALPEEIPEVDFWARSEDYAAMLDGANARCRDFPGEAPPRAILPAHGRHVRYLKVSEGCDNRCAYCAIPSIRGGLRSLPIAALVREAEVMAEEGAREICLVGQDLTAYGSEAGFGGDRLTELLDALEGALPASLWLRLLYLHPARVERPLLERVADGRQILPYLDMPIQHASDAVLAAMNRADSLERLLGIFTTARDIREDFALRTTCMVGFPGETRKDFNDLLRFLEAARFDRVGAFLFSPEEGTPAAAMPSQVPNRTKRARLERLMALQAEISLERQGLFVGRELDILVDEAATPGIVEGRSFREAPEVDGLIEVELAAGRSLRPGDRTRVLVTEAYEHDLLAKEVAYEA